MRPVTFLGGSLKTLRGFPVGVRQDVGYQLDKLQRGLAVDDWRPMPSIGAGVEELRIWSDAGTFRVIYIARLEEAVYVLHAFQKKTPATSPRDLELARSRFADLRRMRQ
jgi:phage-related protein